MAFSSAKETYDGSPAEKVAAILQDIDAATLSAQQYAAATFTTADEFMNALADGLVNFTPPVITPVFPTTPDAPAVASATAPTLADVPNILPTSPNPFAGELDLGTYLPEPFDETPPTLVIGTAPTFTGILPDAPAVDFSFDVPEFGGITLPAAPDLLTVSIRPFDGITIADFTEEVPELVLADPTISPYVAGDAYVSALLTSTQTELQDRIDNGGTGLPASVEQGIWDREREREALATRDALLELDRFEARGYALPPGGYADAHLKITTEMHARTVSLGRDIAIKQAELEQTNIQHALTTAVSLESSLISYNNDIEQRAFDAARYVTEAGVSIYNAKVNTYVAFLDAYKTKVAIYEAQIRGELAQVQAYTAEVNAEKAKADVNTAKVQAYTALIQGALANVDVFEAEVKAILAKADIEKAKVQVYGEQVRGFSATVNAYTGEVEGFKATVGAEVAKQDAFRSQVQAYTAQVQAGSAAVGALIDEFKARISEKSIEWDGYKAQSSAAADLARTVSAENNTLIDAYRGEIAATAAYNETLTKQWQVTIDQSQQTTRIAVAAAKANAEFYITSRSLALDASKVGAQVSAQLASAALNAVNHSLSASGSASVSGSDSTSTTYSL